MKLMQLNVWLGRFTPQIIELIKRENPDIITAQEVYRGGTTVQFPDNMFTIFEQVSELYSHTAFSPAHTTKVAHSNVDMGIAIFSKFPITQTDSFFTNGEYVADLTKDSAVANSRTLQTCRLSIHNQDVYILNQHGYWDRSPLGNKTSVEKMQRIADHIRSLDAHLPLIFAGDFNIVPESPAMRPLDGILTDLTATYNIDTTITNFRNLPPIACDHILVNSHVGVTNLRVLDDLVSDHKALLMDFSLT